MNMQLHALHPGAFNLEVSRGDRFYSVNLYFKGKELVDYSGISDDLPRYVLAYLTELGYNVAAFAW